MKKTIFIALLFCFKIAETKTPDYNLVNKSSADKIEQKVIDWRHDIHQHPELGNRETKTAALIAKHLESLDLEVKTGVAVTGVVGILKGGTHHKPQFIIDDSSFKMGMVVFCNLVFDYR
jgi:metal-dependent amidase/aminoacylase/carboxypeptidase family protein